MEAARVWLPDFANAENALSNLKSKSAAIHEWYS